MISQGPLLLLCALLLSGATALSVSPTATTRTKTQLHASLDRRQFLTTKAAAAVVVPAVLVWTIPQAASAAASTDRQSLIRDLEVTRSRLDPIPQLIQNQEWDQVRTILKTPPVNFLWNMGDSKNPVQLLALSTDELVELIEAKDDIAISLQMCDQLVYDNVFLPFQPGNGKIKIKEPSDLAVQAMKQMDDAIQMAKSAAAGS